MWPALRKGTISIWDFSDYSGVGSKKKLDQCIKLNY